MSPHGSRSRLRLLQWPTIVALTVLWLLLWGELSVWMVLSGVVVAVAVCLVFPLPPLRVPVRIRPLLLTALVLRFLGDVVVSSLQVAAVTLRPGIGGLRNSIVAVPLRTPSDFVLTVVAEMTSLIPGSVVVEAHRASHTLHLHVLDTRDVADVERFRQRVWDQERRLVRALGLPAPVTETAGQQEGGPR